MLRQLIAHYINAAAAANARGDYAAATQWCQHALQRDPELAQAWYQLGISLAGANNRSQARDAFQKAGLLTLDSAEAQNSIGLQLTDLGAFSEAEKCLNRSIALAPDYAFAHSNLGALQGRQGNLDGAQASLQKAIELQPGLAAVHANLGGILSDRKDHAAAEAACRKAIELDAALPQGWSNLGVALSGLKQYPDAETAFRKAIGLDPDSPETWSNLGNLFSEIKRHQDAENAYRKALSLDSGSPQTWSNLGDCLNEMKRYEEAIECFRKSRDIDPELDYSLGNLICTQMKICDWTSFEADLPRLWARISDGRRTAKPFEVLGLTDDPAVQRRCAEIWVDDKCPAAANLSPAAARTAHEKIRIGYFSADFYNHAMSQLMVNFFERHDRSKFEFIAFSLGPDRQDEMRARVCAAFDRFIDIRSLPDQDVAQLSASLELDIAVDLMGFTHSGRPGIFAMRVAPVQVSYLGYPATMAAAYMDYLIADTTLIAQADRQHYCESIAYLPNCYQVNDRHRPISETEFTRSDMALPPTGFVFCCFNNNYKITPGTFAGWMRILGQVEGSVLWLFEDNPFAARNLIAAAVQQGVSAERLVFARRLPVAEHLARHRLADLFLDTLPYNAHTTASDALWSGLPVLTCMGNSFASRVAASLLNAIGLPELIADSQQDYERLAVQLATDAQRLQQIRQKLERNRLTTALFDTALSTRHLEAAFVAMHERVQNKLPPADLHIAA